MNLRLRHNAHIVLYLIVFVFTSGISDSSQQTTTFKKAPLMKQQIPFNHSRAEHKQECSSCHVRTDDDPVPTFPYHTACVNCHVSDFMSKISKLCMTCHSVPLQEVIRENALPTVRMVNFAKKMEEFGLKSFSHRDHLDASKMPKTRVSPPQCSTCHNFDPQELTASMPGHPECYECHTHQRSERLGTCETCHAFKSQSLAYDKGPAGPYYLFKFKHSAHFSAPRIGRDCALCHQIKKEKMMPDIVRIKTEQDNVLHNTSCWAAGCHIDISEKCLRCHTQGVSWPASLPKPWKW